MGRTPRIWRRDENRALGELARTALDSNRLSSSWAEIATQLKARFPERRPYTADTCQRRYEALQMSKGGVRGARHAHHWTRDQKQTLLILCQDRPEADLDWNDIAVQMRTIFESPRSFPVDAVRQRYLALKQAVTAAVPSDGDTELKEGQPAMSPKAAAAPKTNDGATKRRRSSASDYETVGPALRLDCEDGEFAAPSLSPTTTPDLEGHLRIVQEFIQQHAKALDQLSTLADARPESLNDLFRAVGAEPPTDDDCDLLAQWSIQNDPGNAADWMAYAERCDGADRTRWPIIVPQRTRFMIELIGSGRLALVPDRIQAEIGRLHARLKDHFLRQHSTLYCLVAGHRAHPHRSLPTSRLL